MKMGNTYKLKKKQNREVFFKKTTHPIFFKQKRKAQIRKQKKVCVLQFLQWDFFSETKKVIIIHNLLSDVIFFRCRNRKPMVGFQSNFSRT